VCAGPTLFHPPPNIIPPTNLNAKDYFRLLNLRLRRSGLRLNLYGSSASPIRPRLYLIDRSLPCLLRDPTKIRERQTPTSSQTRRELSRFEHVQNEVDWVPGNKAITRQGKGSYRSKGNNKGKKSTGDEVVEAAGKELHTLQVLRGLQQQGKRRKKATPADMAAAGPIIDIDEIEGVTEELDMLESSARARKLPQKLSDLVDSEDELA
jgi:hypothetical protein